MITMALPMLHRQRPQSAQRRSNTATRRPDGLATLVDTWASTLPELLDSAFTPFADIEETDTSYVLSIDLPGVKREDVELTVAGRRVMVTGQRKETERLGVQRRRTRSVGQFAYDVLLPGDVDDEHVDATVDSGVLTVVVPKAAPDRRRRIPIH